MARPRHLTAGDVKFLAHMTGDVERQYEALDALESELVEAAEAAGVEPDLSAFDRLVADAEEDEALLVDRRRLDEARAEYGSRIGALRRGEHHEPTPREE